MGHGTNDKMFITPTEHSGVYGQHGASKGACRGDSAVIVPFDMCALTHQPWETPVCFGEGVIFEKRNIEAYLRKYGTNPVTGASASFVDLVALRFARNEQGKLHDPVSLKEFTDHSHIVTIRPTGNAFSYDTVQQLNIKPRVLRDLVDDTPFQRSDIITLQDPHNPTQRNTQTMYHVQNNLTIAARDTDEEVNALATGSTKTLLETIRAKQVPQSAPSRAVQPEMASKLARKQGTISNGMTAASFTSSSLTPRTKMEHVTVDEEEVMFEHIASTSKRTKAYAKILTNFGPLNIELHVDKAPRTCYNFLMLAREGKYNDTIFHRNISGFMIQGGDPTGTGRGGQSIWGKPFLDELINAGSYRHTGRGMLSMANSGYNTNGSQFFFTYRATPHLDTKHTVFGRLLSDADGKEQFRTLDALEHVPTEDGTDRPLRPIRITSIDIMDDPFWNYKQQQDHRLRREDPNSKESVMRDNKRRKREEDRTTWLGTRLEPKRTERDEPVSSMLFDTDIHGLKGLKRGPPVAQKPTIPKRCGGFGDFSSW